MDTTVVELQTQAVAAWTAVSAMIATYGLRVIGAILILVVGWILAGWGGRIADRGLSRIRACDDTLRHFVSSLVRYGILVFTGVAVLEKFGVATTSFVAVLGAAGLAIGLALQGTLSNVAAGVMLLVFRPFKAGDYIEAGGIAGTVKSVSLFISELSTPDNVRIVVPNAKLWNEPLKNYSANPTRRQDFAVGIAYGDDIDTALAVLNRIADGDARILRDPEPMAVVTNLGESSVDLMLRVWCSADDYWTLKWDVTKAIKQGMDEAGITIPFPQREVRVVGGAVAENASS